MKFPLQHKKTVYAIVLQTGLCLAGSGLFYPLSAIAEEPDASQTTAHVKPRLFVLTDIGDDPDDQMSMVRLMTYANRIDIEGLVATSTGKNKDQVEPERIVNIVKGYGQVRDNLELHEPGFPAARTLLNTIAQGLPVHDMAAVGEGKDSSGSDRLIEAVDRQDERPLWVSIWGGPNVLAQALWKVSHTRTPEQLAKFVAKLRVYAISDQDNSGPWIRKTFPSLFYIVSPGQNAGGGFHHATWIGIGGDYFHGRFTGPDYQLVTNEWLDKNVRSKGPLGAEYPRWKFMMEGDTPAWMNLINNGLSRPEHPDWGGWGGRYELYTPRKERWFLTEETRPIWTNAQDEVLGLDNRWHTSNHATIWRWRSAYQNDFAARMDWTVKPYNEANHPPVPKLAHPAELTVKKGERVHLSAVGSTDPDGDALSYEWFAYAEAGTRVLSNAASGVMLDIKNADQPQAWFDVTDARVMPPGTGTMHIILAVTDHGMPRLTRYQRIIVKVIP
ncbi:nucleoside hydrolase-like domain-containing protein [Kluyvera georgiana]|uniref:nucleoside hydrolase-like domain-containing protein n=1 Tax=Kluyvera georgiana TaxID=73098 RepID=UPI0009832B4E|nr:nucleoside hydrolase-like domain-containing protein [Kluyvera georgiana]